MYVGVCVYVGVSVYLTPYYMASYLTYSFKLLINSECNWHCTLLVAACQVGMEGHSILITSTTHCLFSCMHNMVD